VDGEIIAHHGKLTRIDKSALTDEIIEAHARLEPRLPASEAAVEMLRLPYERIYRRCQCIPILADTYPARFA